MVLPDSRRVSRAPRYLGYRFESVELSPTWLSHALAGLSRPVQLTHGLVTLLTRPYNPQRCTRNIATNAPRAVLGLGCSDFARRYFRNRCCFLFLQVLRWFTSLG